VVPPASVAAVGSLGRVYVTDVVILVAHPRVPLRAVGCAVTLQPAAQPDIVRRVYPKVSCQVGLTRRSTRHASAVAADSKTNADERAHRGSGVARCSPPKAQSHNSPH